MKKNKTLFVLLLIPFLIGILSFVSVTIVKNTVAADIIGIIWDYDSGASFKIQSSSYSLSATPVTDESLVLADGNGLVWSLEATEEGTYVTAQETDGKASYALYAQAEGEEEDTLLASLTNVGGNKASLVASGVLRDASGAEAMTPCRLKCSNERGNVSKSCRALFFETAAIIVDNLDHPGNEVGGSSISVSKRQYGEYDLVYDSLGGDARLKKASFHLAADVSGEASEIRFEVPSAYRSLVSSSSEGEVKILGTGDMAVRAIAKGSSKEVYVDYSFEVIEGGVNVYSYDDFLMATNLSKTGYPVALQTNLGSLKEAYVSDGGVYKDEYQSPKTRLFGHYDFASSSFSFEDEVYSLPSTYDTSYIDQYNEANGTSSTKNVLTGVYLRHSLYGNGFKINGQGLCYPNHGSIDQYNGKLTPGEGDLFKGPLPYLTVGSIDQKPIVKSFGQDNSLIYVEGDEVEIRDLEAANCDAIDNLYNLTYVGTVMDVAGENVVVDNCILSNGRTVFRAYDTPGLKVRNSILQYANEFIAMLGSNQKSSYDLDKKINWSVGSVEVDTTLGSFLEDASENGANALLNKLIESSYSQEFLAIARLIQASLDEDPGDEYAFEATFENVSFYRSGVFSIAFESSFNGPYLYNGMPSSLSEILKLASVTLPTKIGGTSKPIHLLLDNTRFYDWKVLDTIDVSSLVEENISSLAASFGKEYSFSIDDFFPIRSVLKEELDQGGYIYLNPSDGKEYINTKVAWFGGGQNASSVSGVAQTKDAVTTDLVEAILSGKYMSRGGTLGSLMLMASKAILMAIGFNPFYFLTNDEITSADVPEYFDEAPQTSDMKGKAK